MKYLKIIDIARIVGKEKADRRFVLLGMEKEEK